MQITVRLIVQYDNFLELSENTTYEMLGEEILLEKRILVNYKDFKKSVVDLKNIMFDYGQERNSTDVIFNKETFLLEYRILNIPKKYDLSQFNKTLSAFREYLDKYEEVDKGTFEGRNKHSNKEGQLLNIKSLGMNLSFEELEVINNYLKEENIDYQLIQLNSSSVEVGASGGFSTVLLLLSAAADFFTVAAAIQSIVRRQESTIVVKAVDNILFEKAQKLISDQYCVYTEQVLFEKQSDKGDKKIFVFSVKSRNKYYQVVFDEKHNIADINHFDEMPNAH